VSLMEYIHPIVHTNVDLCAMKGFLLGLPVRLRHVLLHLDVHTDYTYAQTCLRHVPVHLCHLRGVLFGTTVLFMRSFVQQH